jgi:hypothetical protein
MKDPRAQCMSILMAYRKAQYTLDELSDLTDLSKGQLSEILNEREGFGLKSFINISRLPMPPAKKLTKKWQRVK